MDELYTSSWLEFYDKYLPEEEYRQRASIVIAAIRKHAPRTKTLLELACGTGRYTTYLVNAGLKVKATDISKDAIERARTKGIGASFSVLDMRKLNEKEAHDVVACFFESLRYLTNYKECEETFKRVFSALTPQGLFLCDYSHHPAGEKALTIAKDVTMGGGLVIQQETTFKTVGDFDTRKDRMTFFQDGKAIRQQDVKREPLLRIPPEKMKEMLSGAGFIVVEVIENFGEKNSLLFIAQKQWS